MNALFSDRGWWLKLGAAVAFLAWLGHRSRVEFSRSCPDPELAAGAFEEVQGRITHAWAKRVSAVTDSGFAIETRVGPMEILHDGPPPSVGEFVTVVGRIEKPRRIRAFRLQVNEGFRWKRALNYGLSIAVVLAVAFGLRRRFRVDWSPGLFRSRY